MYWPAVSNLVFVLDYHWSFVLYDIILLGTIKSFEVFHIALGLRGSIRFNFISGIDYKFATLPKSNLIIIGITKQSLNSIKEF